LNRSLLPKRKSPGIVRGFFILADAFNHFTSLNRQSRARPVHQGVGRYNQHDNAKDNPKYHFSTMCQTQSGFQPGMRFHPLKARATAGGNSSGLRMTMRACPRVESLA